MPGLFFCFICGISLWINYLISLCQNSFIMKGKVSYSFFFFLRINHSFIPLNSLRVIAWDYWHSHCGHIISSYSALALKYMCFHECVSLPREELYTPSESVNLVVSFFSLSYWSHVLMLVWGKRPENICYSAISLFLCETIAWDNRPGELCACREERKQFWFFFL